MTSRPIGQVLDAGLFICDEAYFNVECRSDTDRPLAGVWLGAPGEPIPAKVSDPLGPGFTLLGAASEVETAAVSLAKGLGPEDLRILRHPDPELDLKLRWVARCVDWWPTVSAATGTVIVLQDGLDRVPYKRPGTYARIVIHKISGVKIDAGLWTISRILRGPDRVQYTAYIYPEFVAPAEPGPVR